MNMINNILNWIVQNKEWIFSGIGVAVITGFISILSKNKGTSSKQTIRSGGGSNNLQAGRDIRNIEMTKKVE
jgi:hypothetical protein